MNDHLRFTPKNLWKVGPGGIVLQIDINDEDTPVLVWDSIKKRESATFYCALDTGELGCGSVELNERQIAWLAGFETMADQATDYARRNSTRYG